MLAGCLRGGGIVFRGCVYAVAPLRAIPTLLAQASIAPMGVPTRAQNTKNSLVFARTQMRLAYRFLFKNN